MLVCRSANQRQQFQCNIKEMMTSSEVGGKAQVCCIEEKGTVKDRLKLDKDERKGKNQQGGTVSKLHGERGGR